MSIAYFGGDKALVLCQDERAKASQAPVRHAWSDRAYPEACGAVLASPAWLAVPARHGVMLRSGSHSGQRRCPSRGVVLSDAVAMRCARMTAALNRAPHD